MALSVKFAGRNRHSDSVPSAQLESAIEQEDVDEFEAAYRRTLTQCHACHQATGFAYLEHHVPDMPLSPLMLQPE